MPPAPSSRARRLWAYLHATWLVVAAIGVAILSYVVMTLLAPIRAEHELERIEIDPLATWCIEHRGAVALPAALALITALLIALNRGPRWLWIILGSLLIATSGVLVLISFLEVIAPLYEVREL